MKPSPTHYDKFGRIINVGAKALVPQDYNQMRLLEVKGVHPIMIRVGSKLYYPKEIVIWKD